MEVNLPIVIADSHNRPHRLGTVGVEDWRGRPDLFGFHLQHTDIGLADMVASAATLVMGQAAKNISAVLAATWSSTRATAPRPRQSTRTCRAPFSASAPRRP